MYVLKHAILATLVASSLVSTSFAVTTIIAKPFNGFGGQSLCNKGLVHLATQHADVLMKKGLAPAGFQAGLKVNNKQRVENEAGDGLKDQLPARIYDKNFPQMGASSGRFEKNIATNLRYNLALRDKIEVRLKGMGNLNKVPTLLDKEDGAVVEPYNAILTGRSVKSPQAKNLLQLLFKVNHAIKKDQAILAKLAKDHRHTKRVIVDKPLPRVSAETVLDSK